MFPACHTLTPHPSRMMSPAPSPTPQYGRRSRRRLRTSRRRQGPVRHRPGNHLAGTDNRSRPHRVRRRPAIRRTRVRVSGFGRRVIDGIGTPPEASGYPAAPGTSRVGQGFSRPRPAGPAARPARTAAGGRTTIASACVIGQNPMAASVSAWSVGAGVLVVVRSTGLALPTNATPRYGPRLGLGILALVLAAILAE